MSSRHSAATSVDVEALKNWGTPDTAWDIAPVQEYARWIFQALDLHMGTLAAYPAPAFDAISIRQVFDLHSDRSHFLNLPTIDWMRPTEPQLTKAIDSLVTARKDIFAGRMDAVLRALSIDPGNTPDYERATIEAEADAGGRKRIDLLLNWADANGPRRAVVEAKVDHTLMTGQLAGYRKAAMKGFYNEPDCVILQLSPEPPAMHPKQREHWSTISWAQFLLDLDGHLTPETDDEAFRIFRRMAWSRVGRLKQGDRP